MAKRMAAFHSFLIQCYSDDDEIVLGGENACVALDVSVIEVSTMIDRTWKSTILSKHGSSSFSNFVKRRLLINFCLYIFRGCYRRILIFGMLSLKTYWS